jgi:hypothetical protein
MINELRIGNLVNKEFRTNISYWGIYPMVPADFKEMEIYPFRFKPVPITEEWLERLGFEEYVFDGRVYLRKENLLIGGTVLYWSRDNDDYIMDFKAAPKFVHQLQNLFFALSGEELILKEHIDGRI